MTRARRIAMATFEYGPIRLGGQRRVVPVGDVRPQGLAGLPALVPGLDTRPEIDPREVRQRCQHDVLGRSVGNANCVRGHRLVGSCLVHLLPPNRLGANLDRTRSFRVGPIPVHDRIGTAL